MIDRHEGIQSRLALFERAHESRERASERDPAHIVSSCSENDQLWELTRTLYAGGLRCKVELHGSWCAAPFATLLVRVRSGSPLDSGAHAHVRLSGERASCRCVCAFTFQSDEFMVHAQSLTSAVMAPSSQRHERRFRIFFLLLTATALLLSAVDAVPTAQSGNLLTRAPGTPVSYSFETTGKDPRELAAAVHPFDSGAASAVASDADKNGAQVSAVESEEERAQQTIFSLYRGNETSAARVTPTLPPSTSASPAKALSADSDSALVVKPAADANRSKGYSFGGSRYSNDRVTPVIKRDDAVLTAAPSLPPASPSAAPTAPQLPVALPISTAPVPPPNPQVVVVVPSVAPVATPSAPVATPASAVVPSLTLAPANPAAPKQTAAPQVTPAPPQTPPPPPPPTSSPQSPLPTTQLPQPRPTPPATQAPVVSPVPMVPVSTQPAPAVSDVSMQLPPRPSGKTGETEPATGASATSPPQSIRPASTAPSTSSPVATTSHTAQPSGSTAAPPSTPPIPGNNHNTVGSTSPNNNNNNRPAPSPSPQQPADASVPPKPSYPAKPSQATADTPAQSSVTPDTRTPSTTSSPAPSKRPEPTATAHITPAPPRGSQPQAPGTSGGGSKEPPGVVHSKAPVDQSPSSSAPLNPQRPAREPQSSRAPSGSSAVPDSSRAPSSSGYASQHSPSASTPPPQQPPQRAPASQQPPVESIRAPSPLPPSASFAPLASSKRPDAVGHQSATGSTVPGKPTETSHASMSFSSLSTTVATTTSSGSTHQSSTTSSSTTSTTTSSSSTNAPQASGSQPQPPTPGGGKAPERKPENKKTKTPHEPNAPQQIDASAPEHDAKLRGSLPLHLLQKVVSIGGIGKRLR